MQILIMKYIYLKLSRSQLSIEKLWHIIHCSGDHLSVKSRANIAFKAWFLNWWNFLCKQIKELSLSFERLRFFSSSSSSSSSIFSFKIHKYYSSWIMNKILLGICINWCKNRDFYKIQYFQFTTQYSYLIKILLSMSWV